MAKESTFKVIKYQDGLLYDFHYKWVNEITPALANKFVSVIGIVSHIAKPK